MWKSTEKGQGNAMIDKRIGKRIKEQREILGLTQDEFAEKVGLTPNYISTVERGASFPRCEKLLAIINGLETSADAIFCDVIDHSTSYQTSRLSRELNELPIDEQKRILQMIELMIKQAKENH
jgi:transcriptional regulator with XRE-family HTH domain